MTSSPSSQFGDAPYLGVVDPRLLMGSGDKDVPWYNPTFPGLTKDQEDLLANYSYHKPEVIAPHIVAIRDRAWDIHSLPCIGQFRFIDLSLSRLPSYSHVVNLLKAGGRLLDLGCCFGQDLRKLVHDGAPASSLFGAELREEFIELGYELFLDKDKIGVNFLRADVFDPDSSLKELDGQLDVVHVGLFLHLFGWEGQRKACERIVGLLKPEKGVLILGQQVGCLMACDVKFEGERKVTRHDLVSFDRLWDEVGKATGTEWLVRAKLDEGLGVGDGKRVWDSPETRRLVFEVERVS
ncbi:hypothetical protein ONS95_007367 [Cadophora gregata]|uniref:uncharacterized protein n=1 Tax=Cadophora gregata TaxID=51156 RepID=UPI0026DBC065|nr:uncharacterized protein ONS95_007367 [Cadophora gregata]KAK0100925.1 hypothetical protein ONS95_007367 [Cadophora gregata]